MGIEATWHTVGAAGEPAFQGAWVSAGTPAPQFSKDGLGFVQIIGIASSGVTGTTIFTLPAGFRPPSGDLRFAVSAGGAFGQVNVATNGNVSLNVGSGAAFVDLAPVRFRTY